MTIDHDLALAAEVYRDLAADIALHLPHVRPFCGAVWGAAI